MTVTQLSRQPGLSNTLGVGTSGQIARYGAHYRATQSAQATKLSSPANCDMMQNNYLITTAGVGYAIQNHSGLMSFGGTYPRDISKQLCTPINTTVPALHEVQFRLRFSLLG